MRRSIAAALIAASVALAGCHRIDGEGDGATVARNYQVADFQRMEVAGAYDVDVRTGPEVSITASGSKEVLDKTVVEVRNGDLLIHSREHHGFHWFSFDEPNLARFTITVPQLSGAKIAGSGNLKVDRVQGSAFDGNVTGSGNLVVTSVDLQSLNLSIAGSGAINGGSGRAQSVNYGITGSGEIDARAIAANDAKLSIAGSGSVRAQAHGAADVTITGSGDVDVSGGAKCAVHKAGSGDAHCS